MLQYQELITTVTDRVAVSTDDARAAAEATIATLARTLDEPQRQRLLAEVPARLTEQVEKAPGPAPDAASFAAQVSWLTGVPAEQARYRAQAVLATINDQAADLVDSLDLPDEIREMCTGPAAGGGIIGPTGHTAPLTTDELAAALVDLPDWQGDVGAISRTLSLPSPDLDQVLARIDSLRHGAGRAPRIYRDGEMAVIRVWTSAVDAVTALDVELAHRIDTVIADGSPDVLS